MTSQSSMSTNGGATNNYYLLRSQSLSIDMDIDVHIDIDRYNWE